MKPVARCEGMGRAFTLVEVLAALVLVAIVLPVAMRGVSVALAAASASRRLAEATALGEGKLLELIVSGGWQGAELSGDFGPERPGCRWRAETGDWEDPALRLVRVTVEWTSAGRERSLTLSTLVYAGEQ